MTELFYFEPPVAYDLPPTLPNPRPRYINAHARWKGGQRRGRSVLKLDGVYQTIDTPTVDQTLAASEVYMGGHIYTVTSLVAAALVAAGYTIIFGYSGFLLTESLDRLVTESGDHLITEFA